MIKKFNNYKQKLQYLFLILSITFNIYLFGNQHISEILNTIPEKEKEALERLFRYLLNREHFIYTLFGEKPMSWTNYAITISDNDDIPLLQSELKFRKRWQIWKKYEHLFPIKHYLLIDVFSDISDKHDIFFINKEYFINKINEHLDLFQEALGKNITGTTLLKKIEKDPKILLAFDTHQMLLGILLGYGEHNARLYDKRHQISFFVWKKDLPKIPIKIPTPSAGFSSLQEEFKSYFSVLTLFGDPGYSPLLIGPVHFVADHKHPETIALKEKYRRLREEISAIYAKGDFLEITLSKLTEN